MRVVIDMDDFHKKMNKALWGMSIDIQESLKDKLDKSHGKDTGALMSSIQAQPNSEGNAVDISMSEVGKYLEFGTPPHMPPVKDLEGWAERKLGDKKLAWALAIHIKKFGTKPFPFIRTTFNNESMDIIRKNLKEGFK